MRDAFVRAVMQDVPKADYHQQIQDMLQAAILEAMPPAVRAVWEDKATRDYIITSYCSYDIGLSFKMPGRYEHHREPDMPVIAAAHDKAIRELVRRRDAQVKKMDDLQAKLMAAARACRTRKALAEMLPEFEKYLPADEPTAVRTLPVVANIVADFTKAGWPKGK